MSNIDFIREETAANYWEFFSRKIIILFVKKRSIGPFVFIDSYGPSLLGGA